MSRDLRVSPSPSPPVLGDLHTWVPSDPVIVGWTVSLFIGQFTLQYVLTTFGGDLFASKKKREEDAPEALVGFAAHQIVCLVGFSYAAWMGFKIWMFDMELAAHHVGSYEDRLWGRVSEDSWTVNRFMIALQIFDLLVTSMIPFLRKAEHIGHHASTLLCALATASTGGPHFPYYVPFFFAFIEISSVPLALVDLFRWIPALCQNAIGSAINEVVRVLFVVSFLFLRCVIFPRVMFTKLWPDMQAAYSAGNVRMGTWFFAYQFVASAFLMFLQLFWGYKIMRVVLKGNVTGNGAKGSAAAKETD